MKKDLLYHVYALLDKDRIPLYVGVTTNVKKRVYNHSLSKDFDSYIRIHSSTDKNECLNMERSIIKFSSVFNLLPLNAKYDAYTEKLIYAIKFNKNHGCK